MIYVSTPATVSKGFSNRESVRTVRETLDPKDLMVAVDFYTRQTIRDDDQVPKYFNFQVMFFGRGAENARKHLSPGKQVLVTGELVQSTQESKGKTYVNNEIRNARYEFLGAPGDNSDFNPDQYEAEAKAESRGPQQPASPALPGTRQLPNVG